MKWDKVRLGDIVRMVTGKTPPTSNLDYFDGDYLWVNPSDFGLKYIVESKRTITQKAVDDKKCNLLPKDTILLSCIGDIGKIGILKGIGASNQQITGLITNSNVFPDYLYYFLIHNKSKLESLANKAVVAILNNERLRDLEVALPPLPIQKRIAQTLDAADELKRKDQQLLKKYDELAQAIFIDMFGDPVKNEKGWEELPCEDVFSMKLGKMLSAKNYTGTHLKKYLRNVNVKWGHIDFSDLNEMDFSDDECVSYQLKKDDILVCEGGEVGRTSVFDTYLEPVYYQNALHRLRIKDEKIIKALYFEKYMEIAISKGLIRKEIISVTIQHFSLEKFRKLKIIIPPISLQEEFVNRLASIKRQTQIIINNQNMNLFNSLIQKAFNGQLIHE